MKKFLFIVSGLVAVFFLWLYFFIPGTITISRSLQVEANRDALYRKLEVPGTWKEWWPGTTEGQQTCILNGFTFKPGTTKTLSIPFLVQDKSLSTVAELTLIPLVKDSTTIHIESVFDLPINPFTRIQTWMKSKNLEKSLTTIVGAIQTTYSKTVNLYGYDIKKERVVDSILVFTSEETKGYPTVEKVYALIDQLKNYIKVHMAVETGFPMQNIYTTDSVNYLVRVAIPVNKRLPDSEKIRYRWMLGGGNILITEVRGAQDEVNKAYKQISNYVSDHGRISPAIPFESLVTDRRKEPDSTKWVTRIYYPVM